MNANRREVLALAGAASVAGFAGFNGGREAKPKAMSNLPLAGQTSAVAVVKAASYSKDLADAMMRGILECELDVAGKTVLLKPNFVEFDPNTCINTDVAVVATALEVFRSLGAAENHVQISLGGADCGGGGGQGGVVFEGSGGRDAARDTRMRAGCGR